LVQEFNIMPKLIAILIAAIAGFASQGLAVAATPDVESVLTAQKVVVSADKKEALAPAERTEPGDIIEYSATYTNKGSDKAHSLVIDLPIPKETDYQARSARPAAGVMASVGDGKFAAVPLRRKVRLPDGTSREQDVPLTEYRMVRWNVRELKAGESMVVSVRVRVQGGAASVPPSPAPAAGSPK
jgi:uncharacterized repeat protein (TIGR01451 family)